MAISPFAASPLCSPHHHHLLPHTRPLSGLNISSHLINGVCVCEIQHGLARYLTENSPIWRNCRDTVALGCVKYAC